MKVLVLVASYPPVLESAGRLYSQLSESLVAAGHAVTVITEHPAENLPVEKGHGYFADRPTDAMLNGVRVRRVSPLTFLSRVPGGKAVRFLFSCILFSARGLLLRRQDVILVYSPPLFMGIAGHILSLRHRARMVLNVQDLHPKVLFDSGAIRNRWLKRILIRMEAINYRNAHAFIVYSDGNRDYLAGRSVRGRIHVIPNWVDPEEVRSSVEKCRFREEEGIGDRLLISYVGAMQSAQGLDVVVQAADLLRSNAEILFFLAGEGSSKAELQRSIEERKLENVWLRPAMPADRYLQCLRTSDVCLMTLGAATPIQTVPGKLAYIMACAKPVLAAVNLRGDAAKVIKQAGGGLCVDPGDARAFADAALELFRNPVLRKEMGAKAGLYAERHFSRSVCNRQFEQVLLATRAAAQPATA